MNTEDDLFLEEALDDERTIAFIKNYLPQELKGRFSDEELYYFLDLIVEYYETSGCLDVEPDEEGYINIDQDAIVDYLLTQSQKDKMGEYTAEEIMFVVQGEMEYGNSVMGEVDDE
ncbi:MAG: hypothetical protein IJ467_07615 [Bacteroidaceae bacterium]|nr:hypothetical protein [Bacteroidaceae bacterium]